MEAGKRVTGWRFRGFTRVFLHDEGAEPFYKRGPLQTIEGLLSSCHCTEAREKESINLRVFIDFRSLEGSAGVMVASLLLSLGTTTDLLASHKGVLQPFATPFLTLG